MREEQPLLSKEKSSPVSKRQDDDLISDQRVEIESESGEEEPRLIAAWLLSTRGDQESSQPSTRTTTTLVITPWNLPGFDKTEIELRRRGASPGGSFQLVPGSIRPSRRQLGER